MTNLSPDRMERVVSLLMLMGVIGVLWRVPALIVLAVLPLMVFGMATVLQRRVLRPITYRRRISQNRAFVGETLTVTSEVTNTGRLPVLSLEIVDQSPKGFQKPMINDQWSMVNEGKTQSPIPNPNTSDALFEQVFFSQLLSLKPRERVLQHFQIQTKRRGYFTFPQPLLTATELFGLFETERHENIRDAVLVYPRVYDLDEIGIPTRTPNGALSALRRLIEDPSRTIGVRDYQYGDSFRSIHWKASAHRGQLQTRVYEHTSEPTAMILLNVMTFESDWVGVDPEVFEWAVSVAASLSKWAHESGCIIGISSNGAAPNMPEAIQVRPRRSPDQLTHVLEALAVLIPFAIGRFDEFLISEQRSLPYGAALIIISAMLTPQVEIALRRLHNAGKRIVLVIVGRQRPALDGLPFAAYYVGMLDNF
ncbi:MAG: DUF58 domain-containing protein [Anaerolineae bacterium]|nr:DUF58 domain-containing protein [Anaerolineae bacterium]